MKLCVDTRLCKGCGICIEFCPKKVLELDAMGKILVVNEQACVCCGQCEMRCPDYAIEVITERVDSSGENITNAGKPRVC